MELRHLRYFLAVAEELNFTRAAARLGIGQPPLSQQIKDLERDLDVQLFHRVPHGAELTEAGRAFVAEARAVLAGVERARSTAQRAHRGEVGRLSVGFTGSAAFNPVVNATIRAFRRQWPGVSLVLHELNSARLLARLAQGEVDAAFIRPGPQDPEDVRLKRLPDEPMLIALPSGHALARHKRLALSALAGEPFVLFPRAVGLTLFDEIVAACRACGFEPRVDQETPQISSVVNLVSAELGVSIVPRSITRIKPEGVVYRPIDGPAPVARLGLATPRGGLSPVTANFVRVLAA